MMPKSQVAALLRRQADLLDRESSYIGRTGISPARIVRRTARVACGGWAWIARRYGGKFRGHTHGLGYVPFSRKEWDAARAVDLSAPRGRRVRVAIMPWNRMEKFKDWASGLPNAVGMPGGSRVDVWIWSLRTVADWLDSFTDGRPGGAVLSASSEKNKTQSKGSRLLGEAGRTVATAARDVIVDVVSESIAKTIKGRHNLP